MEFQSFRKSFSGGTWTLYIVNQAGRGLTSKQTRILNPQTRYRYENLSWLLCSSGDQPLSSSRPFFAGWLWSSLEALILLSGIMFPTPPAHSECKATDQKFSKRNQLLQLLELLRKAKRVIRKYFKKVNCYLREAPVDREMHKNDSRRKMTKKVPLLVVTQP